MTNEMKNRITNAVREVYRITGDTDAIAYEHSVSVTLEGIPNRLGESNRTILITRIRRGELLYKLYTKHDDKPLMTIFGCWPVEFVSDIFIRAMEHFYDWY